MHIDKYGESMTLLERTAATLIFGRGPEMLKDGYDEYMKTLELQPTESVMEVGDLVKILPEVWKPTPGKREYHWNPIVNCSPFGRVSSTSEGGFVQVKSLKHDTPGIPEWSIFARPEALKKMSFFEKLFWRWL